MKTNWSYFRVFSKTLVICFGILFFTQVHSQTWIPIPKIGLPTQYPSIITQVESGPLRYIGIGPDFSCLSWPCYTGFAPDGFVHIREPFPTTPMSILKINESTTNNDVRFFYYNGTSSYAIHQSGASFTNYFEGPTAYNSSVSFSGSSPMTYITDHSGLQYLFSAAGTATSYYTTLTVKDNGIKVQDLMECNTFKMNTSPTSGYIMATDQYGNGTWTDPMTLTVDDHDWLVGSVDKSGPTYHWLYSNPNYQSVGIGTGTDEPSSKLHIVDGDILISRSTLNTNSTIFLGKDVCPDDCSNDKWGMEYNTQSSYNSNGITFYKPAITGHAAVTNVLCLNNDGTVGVGVQDTKGFKLGVDGNIICEELKVKMSEYWPDYVLKNDYKMPTLYEVEEYIVKNQHLPGIPSAHEINKNGINVGEMNAALLKKIEELTKYIIEQQKQIDELKVKIGNR